MKNLTLIFFIFSLLSYSQNNFTSARSIEISENNYEEQLRSSIVKNIELTNIGPVSYTHLTLPTIREV